jgi:hypothetical protein
MHELNPYYVLDTPQYLLALALDYFELMGEEESSTINNLVEGYITDTPVNTVLEALSPQNNPIEASVSMPST